MWIQKVPGGGVDALVYAPDGRTLYTLSGGRHVTAWDVASQTGTEVFRSAGLALEGINDLRIAGAGRYLLARAVRWHAWDTESRAFAAAVRAVTSTAVFDPHGTTYLHVGTSEAQRWDFLTNQLLDVVARWQAPEHARYAVLSPDLRRVAVVALKGNVYITDPKDTEALTKLSLPEPVWNRIGSHFSPDGGTFAILYHGLMYLWDVSSLRVRAKVLWSDPNPDWKLTFHPTEPIFAALNGEKVFTLFGLETGKPIRSLDFALGKKVRCAAFSPDGLTCAIGGSNKQFAVFDVDL